MKTTSKDLYDALDSYEEKFGDTFTNIDMTPEQTIAAIKRAIATNTPIDDSAYMRALI